MLNLQTLAHAARKHSAAHYLAMILRGTAVATIGIGIGIAGAYAATPDDGAVTTLGAGQVAAIQSQVAQAIAAVNAQGLTGDALDAAMATAIAQVTQSAISTYGAGAAGEVTSTIIASATGAGVSAGSIGAGLATAATTIASTDLGTATLIAQTVSNEGTEGLGSSFASTITSLGGPSSLASTATSAPTVTGSTGNGTPQNNGGTQTSGGTTSNPPPPCSNPSCT